uniref:Putative secreted protein n=1 Tax=Ixodes ricinus TaxID=34613 RepID=A0A6B0U235_IXORI
MATIAAVHILLQAANLAVSMWLAKNKSTPTADVGVVEEKGTTTSSKVCQTRGPKEAFWLVEQGIRNTLL